MCDAVLVGIINCTPDSFSDGVSADSKVFLDRAQALIDSGAQMLDVGGDSTRPGSICVGDDEEWRRIEPVVIRFAHRVPLSVDTHKAEIARRAVESGVAMINDVTGGVDPSMLDVLADSSVLYTYMFNAFGVAHSFESARCPVTALDVVQVLSDWAHQRAAFLVSRGISLERQVMDTGCGGFLSADPIVSRVVVERYWEIASPTCKRMLGCSRKGFLKREGERAIEERDSLTAHIGAAICRAAPLDSTVFLRVHNVAKQREELVRP